MNYQLVPRADSISRQPSPRSVSFRSVSKPSFNFARRRQGSKTCHEYRVDPGHCCSLGGYALISAVSSHRVTLVMTFGRRVRLTLMCGAFVLCRVGSVGAASQTPNILFIILDDVGIDQLSLFNPQIPQPVTTSNLNTLVSHGVAFNNAWMMPECSPSRACFFTG